MERRTHFRRRRIGRQTIIPVLTFCCVLADKLTRLMQGIFCTAGSSCLSPNCVTVLIIASRAKVYVLVMGPSFLEGGPIMYRCCPSVCLSVPCLHLEGKRKGLGRPNLVGTVPGTRAPRGPISRFPAVAWVSRPYSKASVPPPRGKTKRPTYTKLGRKGPWDMSTPWTNFKNPSCCWGGPTVPESQRAST